MKYYQPSPAQIETWVRQNFDVKPRKNGAELRICSPFDGDDGYHFNISPEKGTCHCWTGDEWAGPVNPRTGKRGCSFVKFVQKYRGCTYYAAVAEIQAAAPDGAPGTYFVATGREGASSSSEEKGERLVALPDGAVPLLSSSSKKAKSLICQKLASRGITEELVKRYQIHHVGTDILWPYYEYGDLVYWQSRSLINKVFRFPSLEECGVNKTDFLYNFDNVEPASYIVVVEAIFGVMTLGDQCVATGGADLSDLQVRKISLLGPRDGVILAPDNDHAGITSLIRNAKKLAGKLPVYYALPPSVRYREGDQDKFSKDWNELYEKCHYPFAQIRTTFESRHTKFDESAMASLSRRLQQLRPTYNPI